MAMMLAPLSLNHPAAAPVASGGNGPFSGGVAQNILPWNWFANFTGNRFSWFTVNLGRSSAPEVEADILENVGSYGRQLGRIGEVLEVLVAKQRNGPTGDVTLTYIKQFMRFENFAVEAVPSVGF